MHKRWLQASDFFYPSNDATATNNTRNKNMKVVVERVNAVNTIGRQLMPPAIHRDSSLNRHFLSTTSFFYIPYPKENMAHRLAQHKFYPFAPMASRRSYTATRSRVQQHDME